MKSTSFLAPLTVLAVVRAANIGDHSPNHCRDYTLKSSSPTGYRCGAAVAPVARYETAAHLDTTEGINSLDCYNKLAAPINGKHVKALTYQDDGQHDGLGTCKTVSLTDPKSCFKRPLHPPIDTLC